ncbi:DUF4148 domain-containing protein [Paraburkholderia sp. Tr-20389]|uniref:DUF4148 domain-containing protein n=1 Tax=Paraburkholderia sp. Tr-20389 TaxID=2703903 RepID=UPI001980CC6F|nr:DUF4148 domain-containing protein [Paraburkholderia sp. Tr-20389]MBN3754749.1 DUF4148 domain-containing protein [Paraburkholderia sp. Tr-20389]
MKTFIRMAALTLLASAAVPAFASSHLTPQQCGDYPFAKLNHPVTHTQLMNELSELESVGYKPGNSDPEYPNDLDSAEARLHTKFQRDCVKPRRSNNVQMSSN